MPPHKPKAPPKWDEDKPGEDTEPEPITAEDISDAFAAIGDDPDDPTFGALGKFAVTELTKRLKDHPEDLPGTDLFKFVTAYFKAVSDRQIPSGEPEQPFSLLDQVDALPKVHARKLVKAEKERLWAEIQKYELKWEELK